MCACVRTTASISRGGTGKRRQLRSRISRGPWKSPQSTRIRLPAVSSRWREPVTVSVAPWKVMDVMGGGVVRLWGGASETRDGDEEAAERLGVYRLREMVLDSRLSG